MENLSIQILTQPITRVSVYENEHFVLKADSSLLVACRAAVCGVFVNILKTSKVSVQFLNLETEHNLLTVTGHPSCHVLHTNSQ